MKLGDIYLSETLDSPLPFRKISDTRYDIDIGQDEIVRVILERHVVKGLACLSILFINPNSKAPTQVTNFFQGPSAVRIFSTIVSILDPLNFDLVLFTPDDIDVDVEGKKYNLYQVVLRRLIRLGKLVAVENIIIDEYDKPILVGLRGQGSALTSPEIKNIVKQVGFAKIA